MLLEFQYCGDFCTRCNKVIYQFYIWRSGYLNGVSFQLSYSFVVELMMNNFTREKFEGVENKCRYWDRGHCKFKNECKFEHPMENCESFLKDGNCSQIKCLRRHPKSCHYWKGTGCKRGKSVPISTLKQN